METLEAIDLLATDDADPATGLANEPVCWVRPFHADLAQLLREPAPYQANGSRRSAFMFAGSAIADAAAASLVWQRTRGHGLGQVLLSAPLHRANRPPATESLVNTTTLTAQKPLRRVVHRRHWGAWIFGALVLLALAMLARAAVRAKVIDPSVFLSYVFSKNILIGAGNSIMLGTVALLLAVAVGLIVAMMRVAAHRSRPSGGAWRRRGGNPGSCV